MTLPHAEPYKIKMTEAIRTSTRAERELRAILHGGSKRGKMLADFGELKTIIGGPGASERFAARMVAELHAQKIK